MKTKIENIETVYESCNSEGIIKPKEFADKELIKSLLETAKQGFERLKIYNFEFEKKTDNYAFVFRDYYEVLRSLVDAYLYFDKVSISNHQCSNAYICTKHKKLEFDWNTLETMRILRNSINYEGKKIDESMWKQNKFKFEIYIRTLIKAVEEKVK